MNKRTIGLSLLYIAFIIGAIGAIGQLVTSVPAIREHFSYELDQYWFNRLTASLFLGSTGLFFGVLIKGIGIYLIQKKDLFAAGRIILLASVLPHLVSLILLPLLTPSDWSHMTTHGVIIMLIPLGVFLVQKKG